MPLSSQPTKVDQPSATGIGRVKANHPDFPVEDLDYDYPAEEHEKVKDYLIDVCGEVGNHVGTAGTLNVRVDAIETGALAAPAAPPNVSKSAASAGVSAKRSREDHKHDVDTAAPVAVGLANAEGSSSSLARADHVHDGGARAVTDINFVSLPYELPETIEVLLVDTGGGVITIDLPDPSPTTNRMWSIKKINTGANKITLSPPVNAAVEGGSTGVDFDLPGSTAADRPAWTLVYYVTEDVYWVL